MIKFSIIIPVYNVENYLEECLYSVINQKYHNFEIIAINDGSTDSSLDILEEFQKKNNDICFKIVSKKNGGQSSARNEGMKLAKGEYIYFLDSDDYITRDFMRKIEEIFTSNEDIDVCTFDAEQFVEENFDFDILDKNMYIRKSVGISEGMYAGNYFFDLQRKRKKMIVGQPLYVYRKSFLQKNNFEFKENIIHEDDLFAFVALNTANKIYYISECLYKRRYRPNSTMTNLNIEKSLKSKAYIIDEISKNYIVKGEKKEYLLDLLKIILVQNFFVGIRSIRVKNTNLKFWIWLFFKYPINKIRYMI